MHIHYKYILNPIISILIYFFANYFQNYDIKFHPNETNLVIPASPVVKAFLIAAKKLTDGEDVKDTLELTFQFEVQFIS